MQRQPPYFLWNVVPKKRKRQYSRSGGEPGAHLLPAMEKPLGIRGVDAMLADWPRHTIGLTVPRDEDYLRYVASSSSTVDPAQLMRWCTSPEPDVRVRPFYPLGNPPCPSLPFGQVRWDQPASQGRTSDWDLVSPKTRPDGDS